MSHPIRMVRRVDIRRRLLGLGAALLKRYPRHALAAGLGLPWALFAVSARAQSPWFPVVDLAMVVGAAAGVVVGIVRLGVNARNWPVVVAIYAGVVNFGIAEFAYLYWNDSQNRTGAFSEALSRVDAAYFSWTTFTTTGFGDITARGELARLAVTCEMALAFVAVAGGLGIVLSARQDLDEGVNGTTPL